MRGDKSLLRNGYIFFYIYPPIKRVSRTLRHYRAIPPSELRGNALIPPPTRNDKLPPRPRHSKSKSNSCFVNGGGVGEVLGRRGRFGGRGPPLSRGGPLPPRSFSPPRSFFLSLTLPITRLRGRKRNDVCTRRSEIPCRDKVTAESE